MNKSASTRKTAVALSASARNTAVVFYPEYTGVSFILPQGRRRMEIHRLVNELDLDWIFNCINRGKIDNMGQR